MSEPRTINLPGSGVDTQSYKLAPGLLQYVESVYVEVDNSAGGDARPTLTVSEQSGVVIAKKRQGEAIASGDTGSATWALRLTDEQAAAVDPFLDVQACRLERHATQTVHTATLTNVSFDTTDYNYGGMFNAGVDATLVTIQETGFYVVQGDARWMAGPIDTKRRSAFIALSGSLDSGQEVPNISGDEARQNVTLVAYMGPGDTIRLVVDQESGGDVTLNRALLAVQRVWKFF